MKKQNLTDLNGYLFEQLERLNNDEISNEELEKEIDRSEAITKVATKVIENASLVMRAATLFDNKQMMNADTEKPKLLE